MLISTPPSLARGEASLGSRVGPAMPPVDEDQVDRVAGVGQQERDQRELHAEEGGPGQRGGFLHLVLPSDPRVLAAGADRGARPGGCRRPARG